MPMANWLVAALLLLTSGEPLLAWDFDGFRSGMQVDQVMDILNRQGHVHLTRVPVGPGKGLYSLSSRDRRDGRSFSFCGSTLYEFQSDSMADFHWFVRQVEKQSLLHGPPETRYSGKSGLAIIVASWSVGEDVFEVMYQSDFEKKIGSYGRKLVTAGIGKAAYRGVA